jgi:hypothetical protein
VTAVSCGYPDIQTSGATDGPPFSLDGRHNPECLRLSIPVHAVDAATRAPSSSIQQHPAARHHRSARVGRAASNASKSVRYCRCWWWWLHWCSCQRSVACLMTREMMEWVWRCSMHGDVQEQAQDDEPNAVCTHPAAPTSAHSALSKAIARVPRGPRWGGKSRRSNQLRRFSTVVAPSLAIPASRRPYPLHTSTFRHVIRGRVASACYWPAAPLVVLRPAPNACHFAAPIQTTPVDTLSLIHPLPTLYQPTSAVALG